MSGLDDFASELATEVLGDMAENFFGSRKRMDERINRFVALAHELKTAQTTVGGLGLTLLRLLPQRDGEAMLRDSLGLDNSMDLAGMCRDGADGRSGPDDVERLPRALTLKGRYTKLVLRRYAAFQEAVDGFMNGRLETHPDDTRRRKLSLHYQQLRLFADRINEAIEKANMEMPVSCVIRYAQGVSDPSLADKERITGAHCPLPVQSGETDLDKQFAYHSIDFGAYGLVRWPELPPLENVQGRLRRMCAEIYATDKMFVASTMADVNKSS